MLKSSLRASCFFLMAALVGTAFSQGLYLKNGESGIGFSSSFQKGVFGSDFQTLINADKLELSPGYSYKGRVDVAIQYLRLSPGGKNGYGGGLTVHALKEDETIPLTLSIAAIYELVITKDPQAYFGTSSNQIAYYSLRAAKHFGLANAFCLIPGVRYDHDFMRTHWRAGMDLDLQKELLKDVSMIPGIGFGIDDEGRDYPVISLGFLLEK